MTGRFWIVICQICFFSLYQSNQNLSLVSCTTQTTRRFYIHYIALCSSTLTSLCILQAGAQKFSSLRRASVFIVPPPLFFVVCSSTIFVRFNILQQKDGYLLSSRLPCISTCSSYMSNSQWALTIERATYLMATMLYSPMWWLVFALNIGLTTIVCVGARAIDILLK